MNRLAGQASHDFKFHLIFFFFRRVLQCEGKMKINARRFFLILFPGILEEFIKRRIAMLTKITGLLCLGVCLVQWSVGGTRGDILGVICSRYGSYFSRTAAGYLGFVSVVSDIKWLFENRWWVRDKDKMILKIYRYVIIL